MGRLLHALEDLLAEPHNAAPWPMYEGNFARDAPLQRITLEEELRALLGKENLTIFAGYRKTQGQHEYAEYLQAVSVGAPSVPVLAPLRGPFWWRGHTALAVCVARGVSVGGDDPNIHIGMVSAGSATMVDLLFGHTVAAEALGRRLTRLTVETGDSAVLSLSDLEYLAEPGHDTFRWLWATTYKLNRPTAPYAAGRNGPLHPSA
jgi:hypothetical protein